MMRIVVGLIAAFFFCSGGTGSAQDDLSPVVKTLEGGYQLLNDLQADFSQRSTISGVKAESKGTGQLFLKKTQEGLPLFRFNYSKPKQQIISNGKKVWFYLPDNRQVIVTEAAALLQGESGAVMGVLTGIGSITKDFNVRAAGNGKNKEGNYTLELKPKKKSSVYNRLILTVSGAAVEAYMREGKATEPFPLVASTVYDPSGNKILLEFSKIKTNRGIDGGRFSFTPPEGVEIIRQGKP